MDRRALLAAALAAPLAGRLLPGPAAARAAEGSPPWRRFEITTQVTLLGSAGQSRLWLPLAQDAQGYQRVVDCRWDGTGRAELVRDARYGADLLRSTWNGGEAAQQLDLVQVVATRDRGAIAARLSDEDRAFWTATTPSAPTDGIVRETAERITAGATEPRARLRAIYDWVVDNTFRDAGTPGCGTGDVRTMLRSGVFGGKCADINGLMVGLARAAGLPARDVYGIRVADSALFRSLGRSGDISKAQHCRAEVFLDDAGWFPVDPADVRKVVLEQGLALHSPEVAALRERLFGAWEMNWVGYNSATDIELPGAGAQTPNFGFLMYPCAFTESGTPDCLDPPNFQYRITARELTA
jgi:transglutaminase-like putative cysteine protease